MDQLMNFFFVMSGNYPNYEKNESKHCNSYWVAESKFLNVIVFVKQPDLQNKKSKKSPFISNYFINSMQKRKEKIKDY